MFKNETHKHPTEIEPFGGAATVSYTHLDVYKRQGIHMVIMNGNNVDAIEDVLEGKPAGTIFVSKNFSLDNIE